MNTSGAYNSNHSQSIVTALVIENCPIVAVGIGELLVKFGFAAIVAKTGIDALKLLHSGKHSIHVIILDLMLPVVDGFDMICNLKANRNLQNIPIFVISCIVDSSVETLLLSHGADKVLIKPITLDKVIPILQKYRFCEFIPNSQFPTVNNIIPLGETSVNFTLLDSNNEEFILDPSIPSRTAYVIAFVPSIFMSELYDGESSFISNLCQDYATCVSDSHHNSSWDSSSGGFELTDVEFCCISNDPIAVLAAAKRKFNLPFRLLSDVNLKVCTEVVGRLQKVSARSSHQAKCNDTATTNDDSQDLLKPDKSKELYILSSSAATAMYDNAKHANLLDGEVDSLTAIPGYCCPWSSMLGLAVLDSNGLVRSKWVAEDSNGRVDLAACSPSVVDCIRYLREVAKL